MSVSLRYDQFGHVIQEVRRRYGFTGCGSGAPEDDQNPHTFYSYNANGALTATMHLAGAAPR